MNPLYRSYRKNDQGIVIKRVDANNKDRPNNISGTNLDNFHTHDQTKINRTITDNNGITRRLSFTPFMFLGKPLTWVLKFLR